MSINATSNYMSNADVMAWMEQKTDSLYSNMTAAMSSADTNADAEAALNKIKGDIADAKTNGGDAAAIHDEVNAALARYGDVPGVKDVLQPIADKLNADYATPATIVMPFTHTVLVSGPPTVKISSDEVDTWTKNIDSTVGDLGKKDSLALINIQEINSEINQAKQTASALLDSADKTASSIINHIA